MRTDDALGEALDGEMLEANLAIRLTGRVDDDKISWVAGLMERLFNALVQSFGDAHQGKSIDGDRRAVWNGGDSLQDGS